MALGGTVAAAPVKAEGKKGLEVRHDAVEVRHNRRRTNRVGRGAHRAHRELLHTLGKWPEVSLNQISK